MSAHVDRLPGNMAAHVRNERRVLDRTQPASILTIHQPTGVTYWIRAGNTEELAYDAADQRRRVALHNLMCGHSTATDVAPILRDENTDDYWSES